MAHRKFSPAPLSQDELLDVIMSKIEELDDKHKVKLCTKVAAIGQALLNEHIILKNSKLK